jgi:hypothetical protein
LRPAAIIGLSALSEGQATRVGDPLKVLQQRWDVNPAACEQFLQRQSVFRRCRMQWKGYPFDFNLVLLPEPVNTPGNEVAPRSNVIGKDLEDDGLSHIFPLIKLYILAFYL